MVNLKYKISPKKGIPLYIFIIDYIWGIPLYIFIIDYVWVN